MADFARRIQRSSSQAAAYTGPRPTKRIGTITRKLIEKAFKLPAGWLSSGYHGGESIPRTLDLVTEDATKTEQNSKKDNSNRDGVVCEVLKQTQQIEVLGKVLWNRVFSSHMAENSTLTRNDAAFNKFRIELETALTVLPCWYRDKANAELSQMAVDYVQYELTKGTDVIRIEKRDSSGTNMAEFSAQKRMAMLVVTGMFDLALTPPEAEWVHAVDVERLNCTSQGSLIEKSLLSMKASLNMPQISQVLLSLDGATEGLGCPISVAKIYYIELKDGRILVDASTTAKHTDLIYAMSKIWGRVRDMTTEEVEDHLEDCGIVIGGIIVPH